MPELCTIEGTVLRLNNTPAPNVVFTIAPVAINGAVLWNHAERATSNGSGVVNFEVIQGARVAITGKAIGFLGDGLIVTIPGSSTATLESLLASSVIPISTGMTIKNNGTALGSPINTIDFVGDLHTILESSGAATVITENPSLTFANLADTPTTLAGYGIIDAENVANKATDFSMINHTLYPTVAAVKAYADSLVVGLLDYRGGFDASGNIFPSSGGSGVMTGAILKGDLWTISVAGTLGGSGVTAGDAIIAVVDAPGQIAGNWTIIENNFGFVAENVANKATTFGTLNNTLYPTTQAVSNFVVAGYQPLSDRLTEVATIGSALQQIRANASATALEYFTPSAVVSAVGGTSPISSSGGTTPTISLLVNVDHAFTATQSITRAGIGAISTDGLVLRNTTAAAAGAQQWSPRLHFIGQGWKTTGSASVTTDWIVENQPVQGSTNPTSNLVFSYQVAGGGYASKLIINESGQTLGPNGGPGSPTFGYIGETNTGLYNATGGIQRMTFTGTNTLAFTYQSISIERVTARLIFNNDTWIRRGATAASVVFGNSDVDLSANVVSQINSVQNVIAGGTANQAGKDRYFDGSQGKGTGIGGSIIFRVAPAGSTGTSVNALSDALVIDSTNNTTFYTGPGAPIVKIGPSFFAFGVGNWTPKWGTNTNIAQSLLLSSDYPIGWSSATSISSGSMDTAFARAAARVIEVNNGTPGQYGDVLTRGLRSAAVTFSNAIASPVEGTLQAFTDSTTATWGATITGGAANHVLGYFNGSAWTVCAK